MRRRVGKLVRGVLAILAGPVLAVAAVLPRRKTRRLVWGPDPLINIRYWSAAMAAAGWDSTTLVSDHFWLSEPEDFDLYEAELLPPLPKPLQVMLRPYAGALWVLRRGAVMHMSFLGGPLWSTPLWRLEPVLLRRAGVRTVVLPFGGDVYMYSRVDDPVVRNALLTSYPAQARREREVAAHVSHWSRHADAIVMGFTVDGVGRWDVPVGNMLCIDLEEWTAREPSSDADGSNGLVRVLHAPNHRGAKGTEYIVDAVDRLRADGLDVELLMVEGKPNREVRRIMQTVDVYADQLILPGYGLAAIEGMASGLPVIAGLDADPAQARLFRLRSFLGQCPVVSASPETVLDELRRVVTNPNLRRELGRAGRVYVERFHSYAMAQYLFGSIYRKLLDGEDVDLMNLFEPHSSPYVRRALSEPSSL